MTDPNPRHAGGCGRAVQPADDGRPVGADAARRPDGPTSSSRYEVGRRARRRGASGPMRACASSATGSRSSSLVVLILFALVAIFAKQHRALRLRRARPRQHRPRRADARGQHLFGTDQLGRDYLSRSSTGCGRRSGSRSSSRCSSTVIGTAVGAVAGYYGGQVDNLLMRFTDLILTLPGLAVLLTAAAYFGSASRRDPLRADRAHPRVPLLDGARADRARPLPLAAREGVRRGGEGGWRERPADHRPAHPPELRRADHRQHDADHRRGDPRRGGALVPRLRDPAAERRARQADRRRPERGVRARGGSSPSRAS